MKVGILLNSNNKLHLYSEKYEEILRQNNIPHMIINPNSEALLDDLRECSHLLFRHTQGDTDLMIYDTIFNIAHYTFSIQCCPNRQTFWSYENKIKEIFLLKSRGFPIVDSRVFWNYDSALEYLQNAQFPFIIKLSKGAGSSNVILIHSNKEAIRIVNQIFHKGVKAHGLKIKSNLASPLKIGLDKYGKKLLRAQLINIGILKDHTAYPEWQIQKDAVIFQRYLPNNTYDTRITVIGDRAFGFRRFVRENDFRASGSGNVDTKPGKIDTQCLETAFSISEQLGFNTMAYDFIYDETGKVHITEMSYCFVDWMVQSCPGYWDKGLAWHAGHFWPQCFQLEDFLGVDLKYTRD